MVDNQPHNLVYLSDLARSYNNLGYLQATRRDWRPAEASYGQAILIQRQLVDEAPAIIDFRRDLAVSQNNLGMAMTNKGDTSLAEQLFDAAVRQQEQLLDASPSDLQALSGLGGIKNNMGMLRQAQGRLQEALQYFESARKYQSAALEQSPNSVRIRALLSNHLYNLADCAFRLGRLDDSMDAASRRQSLWPESPEHLLGVAKQLADFRLEVLGTTSSSRQSSADRLLRQAGETIQLALDLGDRRDDLAYELDHALREFERAGFHATNKEASPVADISNDLSTLSGAERE